MEPGLLFSSVPAPADVVLDRFALSDQFGYALTRGQELFVLYEHTHHAPLHLLAQNVTAPSVVLEHPTWDQFRAELKRGYRTLGITFYVNHVDRLREMCALARRVAPRTRIVLGGYGAICAEDLAADPGLRDAVDSVCAGEGIAFLRTLLGDSVGDAVCCRLPKGGFALPWLQPRSPGNMGAVLSGMGCVERCPFCNTSAFTRGRYVEVMGAAAIYRAMRDYYRDSPFTERAMIYDENFLSHRRKAAALGRLIRADRAGGLRRMNWATFSSLDAVAAFDPEELLLAGADTLFIGVESKFSPLRKLRGTDAVSVFHALHAVGIKTIGSWMIGADFQTPENVGWDVDHFLSLDPTYQQLDVLFATPRTPLWKALRAAGRVPPHVPSRDYHIFGETFSPLHFTHREMLEVLELMHARIYHEKGPALMKSLEADLNGYEHCGRSAHALVREDKRAYFRKQCLGLYPLLKTARRHAPSSAVRERLDRLDERFRAAFGPEVVRLQEKLADHILRRAEDELRRRAGRGADPARQEPSRRYVYPAGRKRRMKRPYTVEYPD